MSTQSLRRIRKGVAAMALVTLLGATLLLGFVRVPGAKALDLELNTDAAEDWLCDAIDADDDSSTGVVQCSDEGATSFTEFEGEFVAPDGEGYAEGITTTSSAREFVVNVTNFVLSFLGLAAVIVIIYGGFLYVTAAGEQERADKGKKSVMYAVIGIIIVLISFALVNTIIQGAASGEDTSSSGLYSSGDQVSSESLTEFSSASMMHSLEDLTELYLEEYTRFVNISAILEAMANVAFFDEDGLAEMEEGFELILDEADSFSYTADSARDALSFIRGYISYGFTEKVMQLVGYDNIVQANFLQMSVLLASHEGSEEPSETEEATQACVDSCYIDHVGDTLEFTSCLVFCVGQSDVYEYADPFEVGDDVLEYMDSTSAYAFNDFYVAMGEIRTALESMEGSFDNMPESQVYLLFVDAVDAFDDYLVLGNYDSTTHTFDYVAGSFNQVSIYDPPGGSNYVGSVIEILNEIYALIQEMEFTTAIITANTDEGNAPMTVTFDALDSYDPSDLTIPDDYYEWDLLGDGFDGDDSETGNEVDDNGNYENTTGTNVSYTYTEPGSYRVALRVRSQDNDIAAGISYLTIEVNPPSSEIRLYGTVDSIPYTEKLKDPDDGTNVTTWTVTGESAAGGLTFDASETTGENGEDTIIDYTFDFGDGEAVSGEEATVTHFYENRGTYELELEVTNQNGVKDRVLVNVEIKSPAALLESDKTNADIGEAINFDASASLTDNGSVEEYFWTIYNEDGTDVTDDEDVLDTGVSGLSERVDLEEITVSFNEPGEYQVGLEVVDSATESDDTYMIINIDSTEPVATFDYDIPDSQSPNRVYFVGNRSYDPDPGDTEDLTYEWTINGTEGLDYDFQEGTDEATNNPIVDFNETGEWTVTLTVTDEHGESNSFEKTVKIDSVLGIAVETNGGPAHVLEPHEETDAEGNVTETLWTEIELKLESNYGVSYKVDWDDGGAIETVTVASMGTAAPASHVYFEGNTYNVKVTVYNENGDTNKVSHNVFVGNGEEPVPVIKVSVGGIVPANQSEITTLRDVSLTFDASKTISKEGGDFMGEYNWNFGDGTTSSGSLVTHPFTDVGEYEVILSVTDTAANTASNSVTVVIEEAVPVIYGITAQAQDDDLITPLSVKLYANAEDLDAESGTGIVQYKFWYYDTANSAKILDTQISTSDTTYMIVNTNGITGEEITYGFGVEVTDMDNNTTSSTDELETSQIPTLDIVNGPNQSPTIECSVDRNSILVDETVTFSCIASDEDSEIDYYIFDLEGDGFYNNDSTSESTVTYMYESSSPEGIEVRVKVADDQGATAVSDEIPIYVDTLTDDPEAAFNYEVSNLSVSFTNNSSADASNGASLVAYEWDFDADVDSDGNGTKDDDADSTEENPTYTYDEYNTYRVKLTVTDDEGNTDDVTQSIRLVEQDPPEAAFDYTVEELTVGFTNNSSVNADGVTIDEYAWDIDVDTDSDGNGNDDDDEDYTSSAPSHTYDDYGKYTIKLTVTDSLGRSDSVERTIEIEEPELEELVGYLTSSPEAEQSDGKIHLDGTSGSITFTYSSSGAVGSVTYCIDKNVYFDTDGSGGKDDDCDNESSSAGTYTTSFEEEWGLIVVKLTVEDEEGRVDTVTKEVKFDEVVSDTGSTNILPVTTAEALYILATALGFTILGAKLYTRKEEETELEEI